MNASLMTNDEPSMPQLRQEVCAAVENEIQSQVSEYEIDDEEYLNVARQAWSRFYHCAIQYHQTGQRPMGLLCCSHSGLVCIIKKCSMSFIRPVDTLEHLVLSDDGVVSPDIFHDTPILCEDVALAQDVLHLMKAVFLVDSLMSPEMLDDFSHSLGRLASPDQVARKIVKIVLTEQEENSEMNLSQELSKRLQQVCDVTKALEVLLFSLELDSGIVAHADPTAMIEARSTSRLFAAPVGVSVLAESLNQLSHTRYY